MKKIVIAGLTALALVATPMAFAQQAPEAAKHEHHRLSAADMKAFTDARVAALKAGLQLTPDQEKNWAPVEAAIRAMAEARHARWAERREEAKTEDAIARMRERADAMTQRAADLKKLADAVEPLYRTLTDEQKHRLHFLLRHTMGHGHHHGGHHHGGWHHHG
ncbi:MAG: Spy/CpxP family protein refolding chaperone [Rhodomicrobium sp.]